VYKHVWQPWQLTIKKKTWQSTLPSFTMLQAWGKANFKVEDMTGPDIHKTRSICSFGKGSGQWTKRPVVANTLALFFRSHACLRSN